VSTLEEECFAASLPLRRQLDRLSREKFGGSTPRPDDLIFFQIGTSEFRELLRLGTELKRKTRKIRGKYEFWSSDYCRPGVYVELADHRRLLLGDALTSGLVETSEDPVCLETIRVLRCLPVSLPDLD
jgi:hypothetical protein